ncbi:hypothetical protein DKX38_019871 [Salix brachista]|uniref:Retroviral polymerase SH3-like domain-containing protein n=1 Tax=Salix brachista TaxID=2182728 RepID=A0A5N5KHL5_9ROSI|nr:hypothetical protein DKX38_019871 [Salix brachista]
MFLLLVLQVSLNWNVMVEMKWDWFLYLGTRIDSKFLIRNDDQSRCIGEFSFRSQIRAGTLRIPLNPPMFLLLVLQVSLNWNVMVEMKSQVRAETLRWGRIVVVLEHKIYVYNFMDLNLLHQIEALAHLRGLCWLAFSQSKHRICVSLPGASSRPVKLCEQANYADKDVIINGSTALFVEQGLGKNQEHARRMGYGDRRMGYRLYNSITKKVIMSRDVIFEEDKACEWK